MTELSHPLPNQSFGKYQILERIAAGGAAEVFKARLEGIGGFQRTFAIKRIRPGLSQNREYIETLVDEAKIAGLLSHANIVQILDLGQVNGLYYVAMEFVDGEDLGTVLSRCSAKGITFPVPHAIYVCLEMLKGLEYAHSRSIMRGNREVPLRLVHRDLSPSNILLSFQGEVKLTDFGIARANAEALADIPSLARGRFDYMSPEQSEAGPLDQRSDIFSVGVVLYEMLCGVHPFRRGDNQRTQEAVRSGEYEPPTMTNPDVPYGLELVLEQALARDPDRRFPDSTAFKGALNKFFHDAGFIFSQSTLAAFLKGLFPKIDLKRRKGIFHEDETRPLRPSDLTDGPVKRAYAQSQFDEDDPDTVEGATLEGGEPGDTRILQDPEEEPTRAMAIQPRGRAQEPPQTLVGPRVTMQDMLLRDGESPEEDWDDAQATEIWQAPDEATQAGEVPERTLIDGEKPRDRQALLDAPTQPWEQESPPDTPRIEKRPGGAERARTRADYVPPMSMPTTKSDVDVRIDLASDPAPPRDLAAFADPAGASVSAALEAPFPAPAPTLAPMDDGTSDLHQLRASLGPAPTAPLPEIPDVAPPSSPDSDNEVIARAEPAPEFPPMPPPPELRTSRSPVPPDTDPMSEDALIQPSSALNLANLPPREPPPSLDLDPEPPEEAPPPLPVEPVRPRAPKRPRKGSRLMAFLGAALALSATLGGGFILGVAAMLERNPELQDPVVLKAEPRLTLTLPEDARLFVDERDVPITDGGPTEVNLPPGVPTQIRVEMDDHESFQQTYTLDYNDLRAITFETATLTTGRR